MKLIVYTDGGSRNNPGPSGAGAVVRNEGGDVLACAKMFLGVMTNNQAEYTAVILGLETAKKVAGGKIKAKQTSIEVRLDSELIARQLADKYQIKEESLFPLYIKVHNMRIADFKNITFTHIPREKNKEADRLANEAMDEAN
ncbi:MAG: ribonuclease HI family protein [Candidatus Paceibacterota bacterium]